MSREEYPVEKLPVLVPIDPMVIFESKAVSIMKSNKPYRYYDMRALLEQVFNASYNKGMEAGQKINKI